MKKIWLFLVLSFTAAVPMAAQEKGWPFPDSATLKKHRVKTMGIGWFNPVGGSQAPPAGELLRYNRRGQLVLSQNYDGRGAAPRESRLYYDELNRLSRGVWLQSQTDSVYTLFTYDGAARTGTEQYFLNNNRRQQRIRYYDEQQRLLREVDLESGEVTFARAYTYRNGRVDTERWMNGRDTAVMTELLYRYNDAGLLYWKEPVRWRNNNPGFPKNYYDEMGRLVKTVTGSGADTFVMRQYWNNGLAVKRVSRGHQSVGVNETEVTYNAAGLPVTIQQHQVMPGQDSLYFQLMYNNTAQPVQKRFYNTVKGGYYFNYEYDGSGRLTKEHRQQTNDSLPEYVKTWNYNGLGLLVQQSDIRPAAWHYSGEYNQPPRPPQYDFDTVTTFTEYYNGKKIFEYAAVKPGEASCYLEPGPKKIPLVPLTEDKRQHPPNHHCNWYFKVLAKGALPHQNGRTFMNLKLGLYALGATENAVPLAILYRSGRSYGFNNTVIDKDENDIVRNHIEFKNGRHEIRTLSASYHYKENLQIKKQYSGPYAYVTDTVYLNDAGLPARHVQWHTNGSLAGDTQYVYNNGRLAEKNFVTGQGYRQYGHYEYDEEGRLVNFKALQPDAEIIYQQRYEYQNGRLHRIYTGLPEKLTLQKIEYTYFEDE
jgi:hypothetical protein